MMINPGSFHEFSHADFHVACTVTGGDWKQNSYIVTHKMTAASIIIDPGDNAAGIIDYIIERDYQVTRILLTHAHFDHVGALMELCECFNVVCELHVGDVRLLKQAPMYAIRFSKKMIAPITQFQSFENECINSDGLLVRSMHTPGHTKGSVCYLFNDFIFTGDTLRYLHVGRTDLPGSSPAEILGSIELLLSDLSDEITIYSGHGRPWTVGEAKKWWIDLQQAAPQAHRAFTDFD